MAFYYFYEISKNQQCLLLKKHQYTYTHNSHFMLHVFYLYILCTYYINYKDWVMTNILTLNLTLIHVDIFSALSWVSTL